MSYNLNINDKRVQFRVKKVIEFLSQFLTIKHLSIELPQRTLNNVFGQQQTPLSRCLRSMLLISAGVDYVIGQSSLRYFINKPNLKSLIDNYNSSIKSVTKNNNHQSSSLLLCITSPQPIDFAQELKTGDFMYNAYENTPRLGHKLQNLSKDDRNNVLVPHGYVWDYDIEAAAPSLLLQYALKVGPELSEDLYIPEYFPALHRIINDKTALREELQEFLVIPDTTSEPGTKKVKKLLHGILMGGSVSISTKEHPNKIASLLLNNKDRIELCNRCPFIIQLKKDLKLLWSQIELYEGKHYSNYTKRGIKRDTPLKLRFTSKRKMASYLRIESSVRNVFMDYLKKNNIRALQIHDGYQCDKKVDLDELESVILNATGYRVKFSEEEIKVDEVINVV